MNTVSKKKTMLACLLAAALGASTCAGGLLLKADAATAPVSSDKLFTVEEGVNVLPVSQYQTADGTSVGDTGLRFQSTNDEAFTIEFNGVFHRSFGMYWSAPADGWVDGGASVVFEIAEFGNPENKFEIHYAGKYQSSAWVEYDYTNAEGQSETLYRSYGFNYNGHSRMVYSKDVIDGCCNLESLDLLYFPELTARENAKARTSITVQKSLDNNTSATTAEEGAIINIIGHTKDGGGYVTMASFRDDPATFAPTEKETEDYTGTSWVPAGDANYKAGYNLPRINFDNGYTVKIHVSAGLEFMAYNVAEAFAEGWTSDPWYAFGTQDGAYPVQQYDITGATATNMSTLDATWTEKNVTPLFYQNWQEVPSITVPAHEKYVAAGEAITPPAATYAPNGDPSATTPVTDIDYRVNGGDWSAVPNGGIPACKTGDEVDVRYNVDWNSTTISEIVTLSVRNMTALSAQDVVRVKDAKVTANGQGASGETLTENGLLLEPTIEPSYTFDFVGRFTGNTEFRWGTAAEEGSGVNGRVEFTIAEAGNPDNYFKVTWLSPWQSRAYVEYVYNGTTLYCAQGRNNSGTYYYVLGTGEDHNKDEIADNWDIQYRPTIGDASSSGILGFEWNGDVLNVMATNESGGKQILASFENDLNGFTPVTEGTGSKSNLPKISFANGYTVSVKVTGAIDFLLYDVTTAADEVSFDAESFSYEPVWYTRGKAMPVFDDIPVLPGVQLGSDTQLRVPELTYTAGEGAQLSVEWVKPDGSKSTVSAGDALAMTDKGDHILRYTVTADGISYKKELTVHVCDYTKFVSGTPATCTTAGEGLFECEHGNTLEKVIPVDENAHAAVHHEKVDATCAAEGTREYWECSYCGKIFADAECKEELEKADLVIPKDDHFYEDEWTWDGETPTVTLTCKYCGDVQKPANITVEVDENRSVPSTCETQGKKMLIASVIYGGKRHVSAQEIALPLAPHTLTAVAEKAPTCTAAGNKAYWSCSVCGKLFLDEEGKTETTLEEVALPVAAHTYGEPEWSWNGYDSAEAAFKCSVCGDSKTLTAEIKVEATPGSCTSDGERTYTATVTLGEKTYTDVKTESISASHTLTAVAEKAPTCTAAGNKAYWSCSVCGKLFLDEEGKTETTLEEVALPVAAHTYGEPEWSWNGYDSAEAAFKCSVCGGTESVKAEIKVDEDTENDVRTYTATVTFGEKTYTDVKTESISTPHTHTLKAVAEKAATCVEAGNKAYWECEGCGKLFLDAEGKTETTLDAVTVPAAGHSYGEPEWKWNGYDSAEAAFKCSACGSTETVKAEIKVDEDTENDVRTYTATVTFGEKTYTDVKTESISTPHTHTLTAVAEKAATCVEAGNKPYWECEECGKLFLDAEGKTETTLDAVTLPATGQHNMVQVPAKAPTCTEDGNSAYYKCSVCGRCSSDDKGEMEIDESSMTLKATGHTFEDGVCTVCGAEDPDYAAPESGCNGGCSGGLTSSLGIGSVVVIVAAAAAAILFIRKKNDKQE